MYSNTDQFKLQLILVLINFSQNHFLSQQNQTYVTTI